MKEQIPRPTMKQDDIIKQVISMKDLHKKFVNLMEATLRFGLGYDESKETTTVVIMCMKSTYLKYRLTVQIPLAVSLPGIFTRGCARLGVIFFLGRKSLQKIWVKFFII